MKKHLFIILGFLAICISLVNCASTQRTKSDAYCEKCARLEKSILEILYVVEEHDPNFVLDVLSETDEWCILEELIGPIPPVIIRDSTYRRMHQVFPDLYHILHQIVDKLLMFQFHLDLILPMDIIPVVQFQYSCIYRLHIHLL